MADIDYTRGLTDPDALAGLPPMASPLTASGEDPDLARLRILRGAGGAVAAAPAGAARSNTPMGPVSAPAQPAADPMGNVGAEMARAVGAAPPAPRPTGGPGGPVGSTTPPPSGTVDPKLEALGVGALGSESDVAAKQVQTAEQLGTVDPAIAQLTAQREKDTQAAPNPADYKPGFGTRVWRGLRSGLLGIAAGGLPGAVIGALDPGYFGKSYGAPTDAYDMAVEANKRQVAQDAQELADAQALFTAKQNALKLQQAGLEQGGQTYGRVGSGVTANENASTDAAKLPILREQADAQLQNAQNNSPAGRAALSNTEFQQRQQQADRMGLRGENRTLYVLNGRVPDPRQATAEEVATAQATRIFTEEHGHAPQTLAEYQEVQQAARGGASGGGGDANLRTAAKIAADQVKAMEASKAKLALLGQWTPDEEQQLNDARTQAATLQAQLSGSGGGGPSVTPTPPPDSVLKNTPEGGVKYGRNGEAFRKVQGKWEYIQPGAPTQ